MSHVQVKTEEIGNGANMRQGWLHRPAFRLSALQAANFAALGIYMPFMPAWLSAQGLSDRQIGLTLAIGMIVRMLASQPITALGDGRWGAARVLVALQGLSAVGFLLLMTMPGPISIMAAMAAMAVLWAGVIPLGDHLTTAQVRLTPKLDFSRMRLWGSIAFLVVSTLAGFIVSRMGIGVLPIAICICCLLAAAAALAAPEHREAVADQELASMPRPDSAQRARLLWLAMVGSALINASHAAIYAFGTLHWRSAGLGDTTIGMLWSIGVLAEIVMFWWLGPRSARSLHAALIFLLMSAVVALLRFSLMPFAQGITANLILQLLHAVSFGAQFMGIMAIVSMLAPDGRRALIQGRLSAVNACLMGGSTLLSGLIYERFGPYVFFGMLPVALAGLIVILITYRQARTLGLDTEPPRTLPVDMNLRQDDAP